VAASFLGMRFRIPAESWVSLCTDCGVLSDKGLCDGPITLPEKSYRVCVSSVSNFM